MTTSTTTPDEIERQHQVALAVAALKPPVYAKPPLRVDEIPLKYKIVKQRQRPAATATDSLQQQHDADVGPCWSSRGHVDVSEIADLIRLGHDDSCKPPASAAEEGTSSSSSKGESEEKKFCDDKGTSSQAAAIPSSASHNIKEKTDDILSPDNLWHADNATKYNVGIRRPSHDAWGIGKIMLVFADDFLQTTYEFPYTGKFRELLVPILCVLQIRWHQVVRLLLASLPPGVTIPVHQDSGNWVAQTHRIHIPVIVNDPSRVVFYCGHSLDSLQRIDCTPGHVFEINNQSYHAVSNCDPNHHRVHMILDYMESAATFPERVMLQPGQVLVQTRRSIDLLEHKGRRPTPSFIILGAQKAGTTSLYDCMMQHPLIVPPKRRETHLWDWRWITDATKCRNPTLQQRQAWMHQFFHHPELQLHPSCLTGDSTPSYLLDSRRVIPRIQSTVTWPLHFFVVLRNPVRRAESHYAMVTSQDGTEAQLKARGREWRTKSLAQVVKEELLVMQQYGLIPYFDVETGIVDEIVHDDFAYSQQETNAWDRYLQDVPLNTGSHSLLGRGMYELNLRPWLKSFQRDQFLVIQLEQMTTNVRGTLEAVWKHLKIPAYDIDDVAPKNQRKYDRLLDTDMESYLERFFAPHNRRLEKLLGEQWKGAWERDC